MTATTEEPAVTLRLWADGTGEVIVEGVAAPISAGALRAARAQGLAQVQQLAARAGEPVRFVSYDPEGRWQLVMAPDGQVSEDNGSSAAPERDGGARPRQPDDEPERGGGVRRRPPVRGAGDATPRPRSSRPNRRPPRPRSSGRTTPST